MTNIDQSIATEFLKRLVGQPLCYGLKSRDLDLYDFGFGDYDEVWYTETKCRKISTYLLHVTCNFRIINRTEKSLSENFCGDTSADRFHDVIQNLFGLCVQRIALSSKNDLWLDLGPYWIVFATFENNEESWRFFSSEDNGPHLVATDRLLSLG